MNELEVPEESIKLDQLDSSGKVRIILGVHAAPGAGCRSATQHRRLLQHKGPNHHRPSRALEPGQTQRDHPNRLGAAYVRGFR